MGGKLVLIRLVALEFSRVLSGGIFMIQNASQIRYLKGTHLSSNLIRKILPSPFLSEWMISDCQLLHYIKMEYDFRKRIV